MGIRSLLCAHAWAQVYEKVFNEKSVFLVFICTKCGKIRRIYEAA